MPGGKITAGLGAVEEKIRALIADGVDPDGYCTLLEELRVATSQLPQKNEHQLRLEKWSIGSGMGMTQWLVDKEYWGRDH